MGPALAPRYAGYPAGCSQREIRLEKESQTVSGGYFLSSINEAPIRLCNLLGNHEGWTNFLLFLQTEVYGGFCPHTRESSAAQPRSDGWELQILPWRVQPCRLPSYNADG